jgi:hypothetical protein
MWWRKKAGRPKREVSRCSFCNKGQDDVKKLIAGPRVFICGECVEVCNDIIADDKRFEKGVGKEGAERIASDPVPWPNAIQCGLCRVPIPVDEGLVIGNRGMLCADCIDAVEAARHQKN